MSTRYFKTLIRFVMKHTYFSSGLCDRFTVFPGNDTQAWIKNQRMRFVPDTREDASSFTLGYEATDSGGTPFISFPDNAVLSFFMRLDDPNLLNVTDFSALTGLPTLAPGQVYYFNNSSTPLDMLGMPIGANDDFTLTGTPWLVKKRFTFSFQDSGSGPYATDTVKVIHLPTGTQLWEQDIEANDDGLYSADIDLSSQPEGLYLLRPVNHLSMHKTVFAQESVNSAASVFAVIDLIKDTSRPWLFSSYPREIHLSLLAKSEVWKYWVINNSGGGITLQDDSTNPVLEPAPYGFPFVFDLASNLNMEVPGLPPTIVPYVMTTEDVQMRTYLLGLYPGSTPQLFLTSRAGLIWPAVRHELPRRKLSVADSNVAGLKIIKNLPNPSMANPKAETIIVLTEQEALPNI